MNNHLASIPFHLMRQLFQEHTAQWQKSMPELTKQQYAVLCAVAEQPGIEQMDLTDAAISTKATLAEMLLRMEKRGLLLRKAGVSDRRRRYIYLTAEGEKVLQLAQPVAKDVDMTFLSRISSAEQQVLVRLLQQMVSEQQCDQ
ncbi:MarR family winged helix-turn-helix transcriptional regulator [Pantoea sp. B65]|uniref:MarR family winged helix-turn-helix transcriptional regulator n=1 Tax=Pantoea sp. B65 TaxID=2813359 RepID=UPI0039B5E083